MWTDRLQNSARLTEMLVLDATKMMIPQKAVLSFPKLQYLKVIFKLPEDFTEFSPRFNMVYIFSAAATQCINIL